MKKNLLFTAVTAIFFLVSQAQEQPKFGIDFSGFVKTDIIWDSRQTVAIREGHFLLYPMNEQLDSIGNDINAVPNFNMLSIQTRLLGKISGPDALGAKTSGLIEGEFFGQAVGSNEDVNGFRLRHAYVKLNWTKTELLVGQFWHPLFNVNCFPGVVSFNTGAPFTPFTRNPQVRLTKKLGNHWNVSLAALSQRDFVSNGPDGPSSKYLRNTGIPAANIQLEYGIKNEENKSEILAGVMANYKMITPRLSTIGFDTLTQHKTYASSTTANSFTGMAYLKVKQGKFTAKFAGIYAQDAHDLTMLGGYSVEKVTDSITGELSYRPINVMSLWTDLHMNKANWEIGLFLGYSENLGNGSDVTKDFYGRGNNIGYLYRIAPRFVYNAGKFRIAPEIEYTVAGYGATQIDGTVKDPKDIGNLRFLIGVYYFF